MGTFFAADRVVHQMSVYPPSVQFAAKATEASVELPAAPVSLAPVPVEMRVGSAPSTESLGPPSLRSQKRISAVDAARVFATMGVIWTHVTEVQGHLPPVSALGRFGTSFYILAAVLFAFRARQKRSTFDLKADTKVRAQRLLKPYLLWSLIYGLLYARYAWIIGDSFEQLTQWWGPFAGTCRHLWFLPFGFAAGTAVAAVYPKLQTFSEERLKNWTLWGGLLVYLLFHGGLFFIINRIWMNDHHLHRLDRWIEEIPLVYVATMALAWKDKRAERLGTSKSMQPNLRWALLALSGALVLSAVYSYAVEPLRLYTGSESRFLAHPIGALLMLGFIWLGENRLVSALSHFGRSTYFIFLSHVVILDTLNDWLKPVPGYGSITMSILCCFVVFFSCYFALPLLKKIPVLKLLVP